MKDLEAQLDARRFVRIRRSTPVNIDRVSPVAPLENGKYRIELAGGQQLTDLERLRVDSMALPLRMRAALPRGVWMVDANYGYCRVRLSWGQSLTRMLMPVGGIFRGGPNSLLQLTTRRSLQT